MLANQTQKHLQKMAHHNKVDFILQMQGWLNIHKPTSVINLKMRSKDRNHKTMLLNVGKS